MHNVRLKLTGVKKLLNIKKNGLTGIIFLLHALDAFCNCSL